MATLTLVDITNQQHQIRWLMNQDIPFNAEEFCKATPPVCGVYRMLNRQNRVIYVGKAKQLPKRFKIYFDGHSHRPEMEQEIARMQTIFVFADHEAHELEYNVYQKFYLPYYNKTSPENTKYLYLTPDEPYQSIYAMGAYRRDILHLSRYLKKEIDFIGPFTGTRAWEKIIHEFQSVFKIPSCTPTIFKRHQRHGHPCDKYDFGLCKGHCVFTKPLDYQAYWQPIKQIFLNRGAAGKTLFKQVAEQMPATKAYIGTRSILDSLDLKDSFELVQLTRTEHMACMTIIEVCHGLVIDIRNMLLTDSTESKNLTLGRKKMTSLSNSELYNSFLIPYYQQTRNEKYLPTNKELLNHRPRKIIVIDSGFTPEQAKELSVKISEIFGYNVRLGAKCPHKDLQRLATYNAENAVAQRMNLLLKRTADKPKKVA
ncbi:GIY-YIG nuclease family protein [Psittacicella hinzii]|nr:GIY-YIG nuclease family protein [Psittacicella hinzii]